ncbi:MULTISPECIES: TetR/AcrR family transcriptional regulator [unclassified Streptomyces]|uniref:TetR/AcrR family transcriptional regulator n=1 Tax=unclassified Streptomyces TaxID=2593676 RepID=UPI0003A72C3B|nr:MULTISPECIES: TetR/AcrR family transcriptional regulator [unclassified Streptomyces]EYT81824.1 TetR family transcriptional regulator [Streptomyces sp. Tu 6176]
MNTHIPGFRQRGPGPHRIRAADTRSAVLAAATRLFMQHGYVNVSVADIAGEAGLAVPAVYASTGGKPAILTALINEGSHDPIVEWTLDSVRACGDPEEVVARAVHGVRMDNERYEDLVGVMISAAAQDDSIRRSLDRTDQTYREALGVIVGRLVELSGLRPGLTAERAIDILWFYLGYHSWRLCVAEQGWSWDEAEEWLAGQVAVAVLRPRAALGHGGAGGPDGLRLES